MSRLPGTSRSSSKPAKLNSGRSARRCEKSAHSARQAERAPSFARLRLHPHDGYLADCLGRIRAEELHKEHQALPESRELFRRFSCELCGSGELGIDVLYEGKLVGRYDCKNAAGCVSGDMKLIENTCGRSAAAGSITLSSPSAATPSRAISVCAMSALTALNISSTASPFSSALCSTRASTATEYTPLPMTAT